MASRPRGSSPRSSRRARPRRLPPAGRPGSLAPVRPVGEVSARLARRAVLWADTRAAVVAVFVIALGVWWLQALVIPLDGGRDLGTYLGAYIQLFQSHPIDLGYVLGRTPAATLLVGG